MVLGIFKWVDMTKERIGLDSLADKYENLREVNHKQIINL